jgi:hypothetical protein
MAYDWKCFVSVADQWIISYSAPPDALSAVKIFSVGHALELYLKACYTKLTEDIDRAIRFGHDIPAIWFACKNLDSNFLPGRDLRQRVLETNLLSWNDYEQLDSDDLLHFLQHQEFYLVCKHLMDLKYVGAPLKTAKGPMAFGWVSRNPLWADLFHDLRLYLNCQEPGVLFSHFMEHGNLPKGSIMFLNQVLYGMSR